MKKTKLHKCATSHSGVSNPSAASNIKTAFFDFEELAYRISYMDFSGRFQRE
jgi:hypothetical protein